jgi:signal transduction histidine kinase
LNWSDVSPVHRLAHELRSPLSAIRLNLQRIRRDSAAGAAASVGLVPRPHETDILLDLCITELERLEERTRLLSSMRRGVNPCEALAFDPTEALRHIVALRRAGLELSGTRLTTDLAQPGLRVKGCLHEYASAILVLIDNAGEALGTRAGRVHVATEFIVDAKMGRVRWFDTWVSDDGPGVPHEVRTRIFSARFTTRPDGAGIGLAEARSIAESMGGSLELCAPERGPFASLGSGAVFRLRLPVARSLDTARPHDGLAGRHARYTPPRLRRLGQIRNWSTVRVEQP